MKLTFSLTRVRLLSYMGAILLTVLSSLFFEIAPSQAAETFIESPPIELVRGWQYRWGDLPNNQVGVSVWTDDNFNVAWQPLQVPGRLLKPKGEKFVWLRDRLPTGEWEYPSLDIRGVPAASVYLENQSIDRVTTLNLLNTVTDVSWPIIPLQPGFQEKTVFFKVPLAQNNSISIGRKQVRIGSEQQLVKQLIQENISQFVLGCFFICIGVLPILFTLIRQDRKIYFAFGTVAICTGVFTITSNEISIVFFNLPSAWTYVTNIALFLIPVGMCLLFEQIFGSGYYSIVRRLWQIHLVYAGIALSLALTKVVSLEVTRQCADYLIVISITIIFIQGVKFAVKGNVEAKLFTAGFAIFCLFGLHDILSKLGAIYSQQEFYDWGMLIFIILLGYILERRFEEARDRLQSYSQELEAKNIALQQMDKLKDEFLANTSHELRTPLNGIIGIAESMIDGATGHLSPRQVANLAMVVSSGRRLSHLVNDILDLSKLRHKNIQLQIKRVDMRTVADVVLALSQPLIEQKDLKLINKIGTDVPPVAADENRVQQIMHNLVGNAIKFTDAGVVEVSAQVANQQLEITVADTGIGIAPEKLSSIFESFEQADGSTAREYGGTGLGLAITKQLVELHDGEIRVASTVRKGSQFTFTLPLSGSQGLQDEGVRDVSASEIQPDALARSVVQDVLKLENLEDNLPSITQSGEFKILIVDDEPVNLQVLVNFLSLQNYSITQASSGIEALAAIEQGLKPDLILLDVMMPKMTGYEVCQKIREQYAANELPVVLLTAKNQVSDLVEGFSSGANDYLSKPIFKNELIARIKTQLQLAKINLAYARFVPHEFLKFLNKESILDVKLGDQVQQKMTILFSDIRLFTTLSERMSPKENFDFINSYLNRVGPVIRKHKGFIDKYIGDAVMALFPESPEDALQAAIDMQKQVALYNEYRQKYGYSAICIGIGLHIGSLMLGTIGEEERMESTVIADAVNLASRLEGLTKLYGAGIMTSEQTLSCLSDSQKYRYRFLDRVRVKGKKAVVAVFEICEGDPQRCIELKMQTRAAFEQGVELYHQQKVAQAHELFLSVLRINDRDKAAMLYVQRCEKLQKLGTSEGWEELVISDEKL